MKLYLLLLLLFIFYINHVSSSTRNLKQFVNSNRNKKILILYDDNIDDTGELYSIIMSNLVSHFINHKTIKSVNDYKKNDINYFDYLIYIGLTPNELLIDFLNDIINNIDIKPILWLGYNIDKLIDTDTKDIIKWKYDKIILDPVLKILYKNSFVDRISTSILHKLKPSVNNRNQNKEVMAYSFTENNLMFPWAIYFKNFMYISETPFSYVTYTDRYIIFCDLLFDYFSVNMDNRYRALVRLEDITPNYDLITLKKVIDFLINENIPFSFGLVPIYIDPTNDIYLKLTDKPELIKIIRLALNNGGTMILHGLTHQYKKKKNPYNGVSGLDFEFYLTHVDPETNSIIYDKPIDNDSIKLMNDIVNKSLTEIINARLPLPEVWEFPHYFASSIDYSVISHLFKYRYDTGVYYSRIINNKTDNNYLSIYSPYKITDIYGSMVVPENLGNYINSAINNNINRYESDIIYNAIVNKNIMRDGIASFFYHPYLGVEYLKNIITGIKHIGYTFVSIDNIMYL